MWPVGWGLYNHVSSYLNPLVAVEEDESVRNAFSFMTILRSFYLDQWVAVGKKHGSGIYLQECKHCFLEDERILDITVVCGFLNLIPT